MICRPLSRRILGLTAIYALVLQSLFAAVTMSMAAAGGAILCVAQESDRALPDHGSSCLTCATCTHAADVPARVGLAVAWHVERIDDASPRSAFALLVRYQPQTARAPPAG